MIISFILHLGGFLVPPLLVVLSRRSYRQSCFTLFPLALVLHMGFLAVWAACLFKLIPYGWLKLFGVVSLSGTTVFLVLSFFCPGNELKRKKVFNWVTLVWVCFLAFIAVSDNLTIYLNQGWPFEEGRWIQPKEVYFRPPLNNDIQRHVVVTNALVREATSTPFLPYSQFSYQLFWHHIVALFTGPFTRNTHYSLVSGAVNATSYVFFFMVIWALFFLRPALLQRKILGLLLILLFSFHADIFHFFYSYLAHGKFGIEADWSAAPDFLRNFSLKLIALTAPQHAIFFLFFIAHALRQRWGRVLGLKSMKGLDYLLLGFCFLSSPVMVILCLGPYLAFQVLWDARGWGNRFVYIGKLIVWVGTSLLCYWLVFRFPAWDLFLRPGLGSTTFINLRIDHWFKLPLLWIGLMGVPGVLITWILVRNVVSRRWQFFLTPTAFLLFVGALLFYFVVTGIEIRRHFAIVASLAGVIFLVQNLPRAKVLMKALSWRVVFMMSLLLGAYLHGYYLFCYLKKPSHLDGTMAWKDYYDLNQIVKEKYPELPIIAAVDPWKIGLEKPPIMEVTTSLSLAHHTFAHIKASKEQKGLLDKVRWSGCVAPYALPLGYKAILWGPVEERVWGRRVRKRFVEESNLLARTGRVSLYRLSDKLKQSFRGRDVSSYLTYFELGEKLLGSHWPHEAMDAYGAALSLNPTHARSHLGLGIVWFLLSNYSQASREFDLALQSDPLLGRAHFYLGIALFQLGKMDEAIQSYQKALELNPHYFEVHNNLGVVWLKLRQFENAEKSFRQALALRPHSHTVYFNLARSRFGLGYFSGAIEVFKKRHF